MKRAALLISSLTFTAIALAAIVAPSVVARAYGFTISPADIDALNEVRAVFTGFWLGLGLLYFRALRDESLARIGGALLLLQAGGRALSVVADGVPSAPFLGAMVFELLGGMLILVTGRGDTTRRGSPFL